MKLTKAEGAVGFRIGRRAHEPLSAAPRHAHEDRRDWGRYDVPGVTLYIAEDLETAFAEVLAPFRRKTGVGDSLAKDAAAVGLTVEEFVEEVSHDWEERDFMGLGAVPPGWRFAREIRSVRVSPGRWLVDVEAPDSIAAIEAELGSELAPLGVTQLTTADLRRDNREMTTLIAEHLQSAQLPDGTQPAGVAFGSKHGGGWCRALWLDVDSVSAIEVSDSEEVLVTDDALNSVAARSGIRVF